MTDDRSQSSVHHTPRGWHSRGYLPHFDAGAELPQFVTFRLADALPASIVSTWQDELLNRPENEREAQLHRLIEAFLDGGFGACHLREPLIAELVESAILHFDGTRYTLHAWVVMPNHIHALFTPRSIWSVSKIISSWKSFTAKEANKLIGRTGQFWQEDYFDRYIRIEHHFERVIEYIDLNPVKAGLCSKSNLWPHGSARFKLEAVNAAGTAALHGQS
jgi:REP element-mobilizing transposase RayT